MLMKPSRPLDLRTQGGGVGGVGDILQTESDEEILFSRTRDRAAFSGDRHRGRLGHRLLKMVGLEVTPHRPFSSLRLFSLPD